MLRKFGEVLVQAVKDFTKDEGMHWSASIAYFGLISAFPLLLTMAVAGSYFVSPESISEQLSLLMEDYVPEGEVDVDAIVDEAIERRTEIGIVSMLFLLWTGTRGFNALIIALNVARDRSVRHTFWRMRLIELSFLLSLGVLFVLVLAARFFLGLVMEATGIIEGGDAGFEIGTWISTTLLLFLAFTATYRLVPRPPIGWLSSCVGGLLSTLLFVLAQPLFLYYLRSFGEMSLLYGPVATIVIIMFWFWIAAVIMLFGGEVATHNHAMFVEGKTAEELDELRKNELGGESEQASE